MISGLIKKIFGDKIQKDIKELQVLVDDIKLSYKEIESLSDNQLREKTDEFKKEISEYTKSIADEILDLKSKTKDESISIEDKENFFKQIEELEKNEDEKLEEVLLKILPQAFSVIKETAKRLSENGHLRFLQQTWIGSCHKLKIIFK